MYTVYVNDTLLYNQYIDDPVCKVINPVLTRGDNTAGSFTCTIPPSNDCYDIIDGQNTHISIYKKGVPIWNGRVISKKQNFQKHKTIQCEGALAFFNDTTQPPVVYSNVTIQQYVSYIIGVHNEHVEEYKKFKMGIVTMQTPASISVSTNHDKTLKCINDMVTNYGGHFNIRVEDGGMYVDYLSDYIHTTEQSIIFGENLLDYSKNIDSSEYASVIIPLGAKTTEPDINGLDQYLTISSVNEGINYVKSDDAVSTRGWIEKVVKFDECTDPQLLLTLGELYLAASQFDKLVLEVSAFDKSMTNVNIDSIMYLSYIHVYSKPHGLDTYFPVATETITLDNPINSKYILGSNRSTSLTNSTNQINSTIADQLKALPSVNDVTEIARKKATELITKATNGFITVTNNDAGSEELLITNNKDYTKASRVWRWNINGLGYSDNGYNGTYRVAMTMDGEINADFITVGNLNANLLKAGRIQSNTGNSYWNLDTGEMYLETVEEIRTQLTYTVEIYSTNGSIFKNGEISTTLIARVHQGPNDVTEAIDANNFKWTRTSADPEGDIIWNTAHFGGTKQVIVTADDVVVRATFNCEIISI